MTRSYALVAVCILAVSVIPALAWGYAITLSSGEYEIVDREDGWQEILMKDFGKISTPGGPWLPTKTFMIVVPPGATVLSASISGNGLTELSGAYKIKPAPMQFPRGSYDEEYAKKAREVYDQNYDEIYSSDAPYPREVGRYEGTGDMRKWRFARVSFCPFVYRPKSGKLSVYKSATAAISYSLPAEGSPEWEKVQTILFDSVMDDVARRIFVNYWEAKSWYVPSLEPRPKKEGPFGSMQDGFNYLIIVPDSSYYDAVTPLIEWKISIGDSLAMFTATFFADSCPGPDLQAKIRNGLKLLYEGDFGLKYVLLVGDIDQIPMRTCHIDTPAHAIDIPTDFYYAELSRPDSLSWNKDGDIFYGELGEDTVDFAAEVYLGRIPWSDTTKVRTICERIVAFEGDMGGWKKWALLLGSITFYPDSTHVKTDEAGLMEDMIADAIFDISESWRMYEAEGHSPSSYSWNAPLCLDSVLSEWTTYRYGFVNWSSHGNDTGAYRTVWVEDYNGNDTCEPNEKGEPPIITTSYLSGLNDAIVYSSACLTGNPDYYNLAQMLLGESGGVTVCAATRSMLGPSVDPVHGDVGGNISLNYYFCKYAFKDEMKVGDAFYEDKTYYWTHFYPSPQPGWHELMDYWNLLTLTLYGDPALTWQGVTGVEEIAKTSTPGRLILNQNSPNPFTVSTKIKYHLSVPSQVSLRIYDVSGRVVTNLVNEFCKPGNYAAKWDGRSDGGDEVASGVYFYRLEASGLRNTKKMVLLR